MLPVEIILNVKPCGLFGAMRKHDLHTGLDLYCEEGSPVHAIQDGVILDVFQFTGANVGTPWWEDTYAVLIQNNGTEILYGELHNPRLKKGKKVVEGDLLGKVKRVLKQDKGKTPTSMLHLEYWEAGSFIKDMVWHHYHPKPLGLLNPISLFDGDSRYWVIKTRCGYKIETPIGEYLRFFDMAADCKSFCIDTLNGKDYTYLTENSPERDKFFYFLATSKFLWFEK